MYAHHEDRIPGYNPAFVARVHAKRRAIQEQANRGAARAEATRERAAQIAAQRAKAEKLHREAIIDQALKGELTFTGASSAEVLKQFAQHLGVPVSAIKCKTRKAETVRMRHAAIRVVADHFPNISYPAIGRAFDRDHTTIMASLRQTKRVGQFR